MKISILTLFPEMFKGPFDHSIIKNAREKNLATINFVNIRDFGIGPHKIVDDKPYGGGRGMILRVDVLEKAIASVKSKNLNSKNQKVILLDARGQTFNQARAVALSKLKHLILICGHYEGIDERVRKFIDEEISIGDFIVTGGEIPSMIVTDAVVRLVNGVLKEGVTSAESFSPFLEYPQYTKPRGFNNLNVPKILLSGDHEKIKDWQQNESLKKTLKLRPDLLTPSKKNSQIPQGSL